jgi:hypothetical protein
MTAAPSHLALTDTQLTLRTPAPDGSESAHLLSLGPASLARRFFRSALPAPHEIEAAIDEVEDAVMRLPRVTDPEAALQCEDPAWQPWAALGGSTLSRDVVEDWFQRLASASLGQPMAMQGLPTGAEAAARLLIVRELMHHLGYANLVWLGADLPSAVASPSPPPAAPKAAP